MMADVIDQANDKAEAATAAAISEARYQASRMQAEATGLCLNCSEPVPDGHRWCGPDCRDDWQRATTNQRPR